jgi:hypothetical protein
VCFGKTLAEANMKFMFTYLTQFFDFEWGPEEKVKYANSYPANYALRPKSIKVEVIFRERQ